MAKFSRANTEWTTDTEETENVAISWASDVHSSYVVGDAKEDGNRSKQSL